jgi:hypothetical protein
MMTTTMTLPQTGRITNKKGKIMRRLEKGREEGGETQQQ